MRPNDRFFVRKWSKMVSKLPYLADPVADDGVKPGLDLHRLLGQRIRGHQRRVVFPVAVQPDPNRARGVCDREWVGE